MSSTLRPGATVERKSSCRSGCRAPWIIMGKPAQRDTNRLRSDKREPQMNFHATHRDAGRVTVIDFSGRMTLGEGSALLRKTVRQLLDEGRTLLLLNLGDVDYIDSAGIGE